MSAFVKAGFSFLKNLGKGQKTTGTEVISAVNPNVGSPAKSALNKQIQKTKAAGAKLDQTLFESKNKAFKGDDFTFATKTKKTLSNTEKQKLKEGLFGGGSKLTKRAKGGRVGLKFGTKKKSNIEKIKKTFGPKKELGMQSVIYGLDKNPDVTKADPKAKFIAAAMKKKKNKKVIG